MHVEIGSGPAIATIIAACLFLFAVGRALAAFLSLRLSLRHESNWDRVARDGWSALSRFRAWSMLAAVCSLLIVLTIYLTP